MKTSLLAALAVGLLVAADAPKDEVQKELKRMEGKWTLVAGEKDGQKLSDEVLRNSALVLTGNKHDVRVGNEIFRGMHQIDPTMRLR